MEYTVDEAIGILKDNEKLPDWVESARKYHEELVQLVYGKEFAELLLRIEHIESIKRSQARKKYSRSIKDLNERILRLIDNVYTATGGSKEYKIKSESVKKELLKAISHNRDNRSIEKWLQTFWSKDLYIIDPSGLIFMEYDSEKGKNPYPTYKPIKSIRNYKAKGQNVKWVMFEPVEKKTEQGTVHLIRFVDSVNDYTFIKRGSQYTLSEERTFKHPFGACPALVNSNIQKIGEEKRFSLIDNIIELEKEYLRDQSVLTIYKFQNGFATPIRPGVVCKSCHGTGKNGVDDCDHCDGEGMVLRKDVTDEIIIPISLDKEEGYNLPSNIFEYMSPPLEIWDQYKKELQEAENRASDTLWGTHKERFENERTAYETFIDTQPVTTKLSEISEVAEYMEWQITEWIANYMIPTKPADEPVSVISYGKAFIIEPPEAIMERYRTNKEAGVSTVVLDRQMFEYITSKYKNNPQVLHRELMKKELDYYVHFTIDEVREVFGAREAQKKMLFTDWWETVNFDQNESIEQLKSERDSWITEQIDNLIIPQNE